MFFSNGYLPDWFLIEVLSRLHTRFNTVHFPYIVSPEGGEGYNIVAVSDGLVLYDRGVCVEVSDYHIYNAITGHCVTVPRPSMCFGYVSTGFLAKSEGGSLKSYKVVRFDCQFDVHQGRLRYTEVSVVPVYPFGFSSISVWVLDEYDSSSWTLQHRVKIEPFV
ncbi:hypothetical protein HAX54_042879 [Datura stramonium]|uniref:F-box associated domain-containing protein n=1 Tax=Datura stramonium TaxID=4076 RepID=A0ABS8W3T4_DATST|nr:hypothetical protein [Datura stramonium]